MTTNNQFYIHLRNALGQFRLAFGRCFLLLAIFIAFKTVSFGSKIPVTNINEVTGISAALQAEWSPWHHDGETAASNQYFECSDEDEQDDSDSNCYALPGREIIHLICSGVSTFSGYTPPSASLSAWLPVPLFVLHHSWKSYIAA